MSYRLILRLSKRHITTLETRFGFEIESTDKDKLFAILALNKCLTIYTLNIDLKRVFRLREPFVHRK